MDLKKDDSNTSSENPSDEFQIDMGRFLVAGSISMLAEEPDAEDRLLALAKEAGFEKAFFVTGADAPIVSLACSAAAALIRICRMKAEILLDSGEEKEESNPSTATTKWLDDEPASKLRESRDGKGDSFTDP